MRFVLRCLPLASLALLLTAWAGSANASDSESLAAGGTGTLIIQAVDGFGKSVPGALVTVFDAGTSAIVAQGSTGATGKVSFVLSHGTFNVFASKVLPGPWPSAIFGSGSFTLSGKVGGGQVVLNQSAP